MSKKKKKSFILQKTVMETQRGVDRSLLFLRTGDGAGGGGSVISRGPEVGMWGSGKGGCGGGGWSCQWGKVRALARGQSRDPHQPSERKRAKRARGV